MKRLKLKLIFNKPYNPEYNPIESVFGVLKTLFRKLKLRAIVEDKMVDSQILVSRALNLIKN